MTIGSSSVKAPSRRSADLFQTRNPVAARPGLGPGRRPPPQAAAPWPTDASGPQSAPSRPPQGSRPSSGRWTARWPSPAEPPRRSSSPQPARSARSEPSARPDHRGPTHGSDPASRTDLTARPGILTRDTLARSGAGVAGRRLRSPRVQHRKGSLTRHQPRWLHHAHCGEPQPSCGPGISARLRRSPAANPQVKSTSLSRAGDREPTRARS